MTHGSDQSLLTFFLICEGDTIFKKLVHFFEYHGKVLVAYMTTLLKCICHQDKDNYYWVDFSEGYCFYIG